MFRVVCAGTSDVFQGYDGVETESFGNGLEPCGTKGTFRVNVNGLAFGATIGDGELTRNTQGMTKLCFPGPEFSKDFGDGSGFNPPFEQFVQFRRPGGQGDECLAVFQGIGGRFEFHGHHGFDQLFEFGHLGFGNSLDVGEFTNRGVRELCVYRYKRKKDGTTKSGVRETQKGLVCGGGGETYRLDRVVSCVGRQGEKERRTNAYTKRNSWVSPPPHPNKDVPAEVNF